MFYVKENFNGENYSIVDTSDNSVDICSIAEIKQFLSYGIAIKGVSIDSKGMLSIKPYNPNISSIESKDTYEQSVMRKHLLDYAGNYEVIVGSAMYVNNTDYIKYANYVLRNKVTNELIEVRCQYSVLAFIKKVLKVQCDIKKYTTLAKDRATQKYVEKSAYMLDKVPVKEVPATELANECVYMLFQGNDMLLADNYEGIDKSKCKVFLMHKLTSKVIPL